MPVNRDVDPVITGEVGEARAAGGSAPAGWPWWIDESCPCQILGHVPGKEPGTGTTIVVATTFSADDANGIRFNRTIEEMEAIARFILAAAISQAERSASVLSGSE